MRAAGGAGGRRVQAVRAGQSLAGQGAAGVYVYVYCTQACVGGKEAKGRIWTE
jgi:hypothetical protein